jgi:tetratricopeptide (TPR) repeat protein
LEKRIESLHITRSILDRVERLSVEANDISKHIDMVARLSNLALQLYSWFIKHGHARNEKDEASVIRFMKDNLPATAWDQTGFYERLYLYQSYTWYAFIRQDFLMYYRYAQKWVDLFRSQPVMIRVETGHYIKGLHSLLNAHFDLRNFQKFGITLKEFEVFAKTERVTGNDSFRIQSFIYIASAKVNYHCMTGTFKEGLPLVPGIEEKMNDYELFIDTHRILVLNYKIASLYFGSGDYATSIDYLQKIINNNTDLRDDLQCYARLVHLLAHYELGNTEIMESLVRSVYRFMGKMGNLTVVEEEMLRFLRNSFNATDKKIRPELEKLLNKIKHLEKNRFETRAFAYLDIISWLESKVYEKPMSTIIHDKYLKSKKRIYP